jgi:hypothetical protein
MGFPRDGLNPLALKLRPDAIVAKDIQHTGNTSAASMNHPSFMHPREAVPGGEDQPA